MSSVDSSVSSEVSSFLSSSSTKLVNPLIKSCEKSSSKSSFAFASFTSDSSSDLSSSFSSFSSIASEFSSSFVDSSITPIIVSSRALVKSCETDSILSSPKLATSGISSAVGVNPVFSSVLSSTSSSAEILGISISPMLTPLWTGESTTSLNASSATSGAIPATAILSLGTFISSTSSFTSSCETFPVNASSTISLGTSTPLTSISLVSLVGVISLCTSGGKIEYSVISLSTVFLLKYNFPLPIPIKLKYSLLTKLFPFISQTVASENWSLKK